MAGRERIEVPGAATSASMNRPGRSCVVVRDLTGSHVTLEATCDMRVGDAKRVAAGAMNKDASLKHVIFHKGSRLKDSTRLVDIPGLLQPGSATSASASALTPGTPSIRAGSSTPMNGGFHGEPHASSGADPKVCGSESAPADAFLVLMSFQRKEQRQMGPVLSSQHGGTPRCAAAATSLTGPRGTGTAVGSPRLPNSIPFSPSAHPPPPCIIPSNQRFSPNGRAQSNAVAANKGCAVDVVEQRVSSNPPEPTAPRKDGGVRRTESTEIDNGSQTMKDYLLSGAACSREGLASARSASAPPSPPPEGVPVLGRPSASPPAPAAPPPLPELPRLPPSPAALPTPAAPIWPASPPRYLPFHAARTRQLGSPSTDVAKGTVARDCGEHASSGRQQGIGTVGHTATRAGIGNGVTDVRDGTINTKNGRMDKGNGGTDLMDGSSMGVDNDMEKGGMGSKVERRVGRKRKAEREEEQAAGRAGLPHSVSVLDSKFGLLAAVYGFLEQRTVKATWKRLEVALKDLGSSAEGEAVALQDIRDMAALAPSVIWTWEEEDEEEDEEGKVGGKVEPVEAGRGSDGEEVSEGSEGCSSHAREKGAGSCRDERDRGGRGRQGGKREEGGVDEGREDQRRRWGKAPVTGGEKGRGDGGALVVVVGMWDPSRPPEQQIKRGGMLLQGTQQRTPRRSGVRLADKRRAAFHSALTAALHRIHADFLAHVLPPAPLSLSHPAIFPPGTQQRTPHRSAVRLADKRRAAFHSALTAALHRIHADFLAHVLPPAPQSHPASQTHPSVPQSRRSASPVAAASGQGLRGEESQHGAAGAGKVGSEAVPGEGEDKDEDGDEDAGSTVQRERRMKGKRRLKTAGDVVEERGGGKGEEAKKQGRTGVKQSADSMEWHADFPFEDISVSMLLAEAASFHSSQYTDNHTHAELGGGGKGGKAKQQRKSCIGRQSKQRRKGGAAGDESDKTGEVEEGAVEDGDGAEKDGKKGGCDGGAGCGDDEWWEEAGIGSQRYTPPCPPRQLKKVPPCNSTETMSAPQLLEHLKQGLGSLGQVVHCEELPQRKPRYGKLASQLCPATWHALARAGVSQLYSHQVKAIGAALAGRHATIATATASGKSLCYNVPVLHTLLSHPHATALYLFPTKLYEGAVYLQQGRTFLVTSLDLEKREARCVRADVRYYTKTIDMVTVTIKGGTLAFPYPHMPSAKPASAPTDIMSAHTVLNEAMTSAAHAAAPSEPMTSAHVAKGSVLTSAQTAPCEVTTRWTGYRKMWRGSGEPFETVEMTLPDVTYATQVSQLT
ncbi:unnamed protein product [Closterium sp. Naga37s-1]|nr:unnamed protein product [Closterium sp. Naga37s-1]